MTRHQRRKASALRKQAANRREIVRNNLSNPVVREHTESLISQVYANRMDRARGRGTTPIHYLVERIIKVEQGPCGWNSNR